MSRNPLISLCNFFTFSIYYIFSKFCTDSFYNIYNENIYHVIVVVFYHNISIFSKLNIANTYHIEQNIFFKSFFFKSCSFFLVPIYIFHSWENMKLTVLFHFYRMQLSLKLIIYSPHILHLLFDLRRNLIKSRCRKICLDEIFWKASAAFKTKSKINFFAFLLFLNVKLKCHH